MNRCTSINITTENKTKNKAINKMLFRSTGCRKKQCNTYNNGTRVILLLYVSIISSTLLTSYGFQQQQVVVVHHHCIPTPLSLLGGNTINARLSDYSRVQFIRKKVFQLFCATTATTTAVDADAGAYDDVNGDDDDDDDGSSSSSFDATLALWCAGLAFDAYAEPSDSSRWERGSKGTNVAFISNAYARDLYSGLLEVTPLSCSDLPKEDDTAENLMTGGGVDAYLLCAVVEGKTEQDVKYIENEKFNDGVIGLSSSAHVGRSITAWSNINEKKAKEKAAKNSDKYYAYHIPATWSRGGEAVWNDRPMYVYVSNPGKARLVFSVMDEDLVGEDGVIGSVFKPVVSLLPDVENAWDIAKKKLLEKLLKEGVSDIGSIDIAKSADFSDSIAQAWEGDLKLTSKPKKKDKGGQVTAGAVAGAMIAGPVGAAAGGFLGSLYEEPARGKLKTRVRYIPIPPVSIERKRYRIRGGTPGVDWPDLYFKHVKKLKECDPLVDLDIAGEDFEFCVYVNNEETECSCGIYRSLEKRLIAVSFRGTTVPKDLLTDASIIQCPWVEGSEVKKDDPGPMVHVGFRSSLNSISRRLKELIIAAVPPEHDLSMYDVVITGHSLGGALATLFTTDVAEYGFDAGRGLPQLKPSEPWWERLVNTKNGIKGEIKPPRPKSLRLYSFGSPRVGNSEFVQLFDSLNGNGYNQAYRVVNDQDVVARLPRTVNALVASVGYDHCGATALVSVPKVSKTTDNQESPKASNPILWVEGESDDGLCPVRDGTPLTSPLASGALLGDIYESVKKARDAGSVDQGSNWNEIVQNIGGRLSSLTPTDITSVFGIDKKYAEREVKMIQSITSGEAIAHHMEDEYYQGMGRACGFIARVGEDIVEAV